MRQGLIYRSHIEKSFLLSKQKNLQGGAKIWPFGGHLKKKLPVTAKFAVTSEVTAKLAVNSEVTANFVVTSEVTAKFAVTSEVTASLL